MKITNLEVISLAYNNQLSLELRHQWFKRIGWDPVNVARHEVHGKIVNWSMSITMILFFAMIMLPLPYAGWALAGFLVSAALTFLCWWYHEVVPGLGKYGFNEALGCFLTWIGDSEPRESAEIAKMDLPELRKLAEGVLVKTAKEVLICQRNEGNGLERDPIHIATKSAHLAQLKRQYDTLESLGLAYGGLDHFYSVAERQLEEQGRVEAAAAVNTSIKD